MSYAIFRCKSINTLENLSHIGSNNKREKDSYKSNPDIKKEDSINNIELVKCNSKYREKFCEITKEYRKEHEEEMKTIRQDRYKTFNQMIDDYKSCVADEMIFTSGPEFFKDMTKEEILKDFFRRILLSKNENDKNKTINILKECYEKDFYKPSDLIEISKDTDKEIEVNDFIKEETLEKEYDYFD